MTPANTPMSGSYKTVFVISILMIFVVIIGGIASGSKVVGFGVWYWGYTAWKMYKRDNHSLVSLQKIMLWFVGISVPLAAIALTFSNSSVRTYEHYSPIGLLVVGSIVMLIHYSLLFFFRRQASKRGITKPADIADTLDIDDKYWEVASRELATARIEACWAKCFAMSDGDEMKAQALYLKTRANDLMRAERLGVPQGVVDHSTANKTSSLSDELRLFFSSFNNTGKIALIGIAALIIYTVVSNTSNQSDSHRKLAPAPIAIDRGSSWADAVSQIERGIRDGSISVGTIEGVVIFNEGSSLDKPWNRFRETLSEKDVSIIEAKNIWWISSDKFYIRLYNPSESDLLGFNFSIFDSRCSEKSSHKMLLNFDLRGAALRPYSYGVYSSTLPFDYTKLFGSGTKCGIVTTAFIRK